MNITRKSVKAVLYDDKYYMTKNHGYKEFLDGNKLPKEFNKFIFSNIKKNDNVLDIGCGRGEIIVQCCKKGIKCRGVDYSSSAINISKEALKKLKYNSNLVQIMDAKKLIFTSNSFNVVIMMDVVEHLYSWELNEAINEAHRVLKNNGKILIHTSPNSNNMRVLRKVTSFINFKLDSDRYHVNEQNPKSIRDTISKKFKIISVKKSKEKLYFSEQVRSRGIIIRVLSRIIDFIYDSSIIIYLMRNNFISDFLCTDIYVVGKKYNTRK